MQPRMVFGRDGSIKWTVNREVILTRATVIERGRSSIQDIDW